jgi:hypothetical protein
MKRFLAFFAVAGGLMGALALAADAPAGGTTPGEAQKGVRYKSGKDLNFEELLINGQIQRPEISVVTGNTQQGTDGLLRLRENFLDRVSMDYGEEVK